MNETNLHRAARLVQANSSLTFQQARALLEARPNTPRPRTAQDVAALLTRTSEVHPIAAVAPAAADEHAPAVDRSRYTVTGRCHTCRSYTSDIGTAGTCYPCDALACGDLISCVMCGCWVPAQDAHEPCEECGWPVTYSTQVVECIQDGAHLISVDDDGYCNACGHQEPYPVNAAS